MKYYILPSDEPTFELLFSMCAEADFISEDGDPAIYLDEKEFKSFERAERAYNKWQDKLSEMYCEAINKKRIEEKKKNAKPRESFQSMEDYNKEVSEFLE